MFTILLKPPIILDVVSIPDVFIKDLMASFLESDSSLNIPLIKSLTNDKYSENTFYYLLPYL